MDYTSQLNSIISRLNDILDKLTDFKNIQYIIIGLVAIVLVLNAIKGE